MSLVVGVPAEWEKLYTRSFPLRNSMAAAAGVHVCAGRHPQHRFHL